VHSLSSEASELAYAKAEHRGVGGEFYHRSEIGTPTYRTRCLGIDKRNPLKL